MVPKLNLLRTIVLQIKGELSVCIIHTHTHPLCINQKVWPAKSVRCTKYVTTVSLDKGHNA